MAESLSPTTETRTELSDAQRCFLEEKKLDSLSISQLRALLAFVQARSVTGAASLLRRDQSTISRQLNYIASALPFSLSRKSGKETIPTNRAIALAERVSAVLGELGSFIEENSDRALWVRLGCGATSLHSLVVPNLEKIRSLFTDVDRGPDGSLRQCRIHLANVRSNETVARLLDGRVDFGVVRNSALNLTKELESRMIGAVGYILVIAPRFAEKLGISSLEDIVQKSTPVVTLSGNGEFKRELRARLEDTTLRLNLTDELDFFSDVVMAVRCNPVAGIVPKTALANEPDERLFFAIPLPFFESEPSTGRPPYERTFNLVWNPRLALDKFVPKQFATDAAVWFHTKMVDPLLNVFASTLKRAEVLARLSRPIERKTSLKKKETGRRVPQLLSST
jgi:DNA-binding transcriptional LysR family regulator